MDIDWIKFKKETFLGNQGELINEQNFQTFFEKHGEEKAIIYLQAMNDFTRQLEVILDGGFVRNGFTTTGKKLQSKIENLVDHNDTFLKTHTNNGIIVSTPKP